jgi:hypothetical protein
MSEDTQAQSTSPNISIGDLVLTAQIVQLGASRGIFKPEEFAQIGDFYTRLVGFLEASGAVQRAPTQTEAAAEEPAAQSKEKANAKTRRKA